MKAIAQDRYGSADVLRFEEVGRLEVGDDDVLIRVRAAGVNALDWHVMRGSPFVVRPMLGGWRAPRPTVRGVDVAGDVESVGKDVTGFEPGDAVFGWCTGAFAESASAPADHLVLKPAALTFEQAAAIPLSSITALQGLRDAGRLQRGQRVLIVGASGGVGTFAVQIAKALGAEVTAACHTRNGDLVRSIGADHVIDYTRDDPTRSGPLRPDLRAGRDPVRRRVPPRADRHGHARAVVRGRRPLAGTDRPDGQGEDQRPVHVADRGLAGREAQPRRPARRDRAHRGRGSCARSWTGVSASRRRRTRSATWRPGTPAARP